MPTFCFHGKSVSNIFPWVFTKSEHFLHNYILAIKQVEDCSWAFPLQYVDNDTLYLPPVKQCRRVHAALQNVYAETLDKSRSTPSPLLLVKQMYINNMVGNSERYQIVVATEQSTEIITFFFLCGSICVWGLLFIPFSSRCCILCHCRIRIWNCWQQDFLEKE